MAVYKSIYKRFNGADWDTHYLATSSDLIVLAGYDAIMTEAERSLITSFLGNGTTDPATPSVKQVAQNYVLAGPTSGTGAITFRALALGDIPSLSSLYLPLSGGELTNDLTIGYSGTADVSRVIKFGGFFSSGYTKALGMVDGNLQFDGVNISLSTHNHNSVYQPLDADLTAIAALAGTSGLLKKTAANAWDLDTTAYITGINKSMVEDVLTGLITTHSHAYLPLSGGTLTGDLAMEQRLASGDSGSKSIVFDGRFDSSTFSKHLFVHKDGSLYFGTTPADIVSANYRLVNKAYVDNLVAGGTRPASNGPVVAATLVNITLSGTQTIDGHAVSIGNRVLVKNQTSAAENGIYTVASGAWTKDITDSVAGILVFVEYGDEQNDWLFYAEDNTTWAEFSKVDTITVNTSDGLSKTGTQIGISAGSTSTGIPHAKIKHEALALKNTWSSLANYNTADVSLNARLSDIVGAITMLRGSATYNTSNTETIAGAYDLAEVKNRTYISLTGVTPISGDIHLETVV